MYIDWLIKFMVNRTFHFWKKNQNHFPGKYQHVEAVFDEYCYQTQPPPSFILLYTIDELYIEGL